MPIGTEDCPRGGALLHNLLLFGRVCKGLGMAVSPTRMAQAARALEWVDLTRKQEVYHALRALIVTQKSDLEPFEEAFRLFWRQRPEGWTQLNLQSLGERRRRKKTQFLPSEQNREEEGQASAGPPTPILVPVYSAGETLRHKDFAEMTGEELAMARQLIRRLGSSLNQQRTRRFARGRGRQLDPRRALRNNLRFFGEPLTIPRRRSRIKPRPVVLICDVSGSMERYTRLLLHFAHALSAGPGQIESFLFSTRLTRITRPLRVKSVDRALKEVGSLVKDWAGGTQTGPALKQFNYRWSRRVLGRGAVVLLITDGWDRGDPVLLEREASRLRLSSRRLIWLNPLLGGPEYEPLTRGARAMLPHVDDFLSVRNLASLETLGEELSSIDWRRPAK